MKHTDIAPLLQVLNAGGIAVLRTDTLYGIVASAHNEQAVRRVHAVKHRSPNKALIVLIATPEDAYSSAELIAQHMDTGTPTTIIVDSPSAPDWIRHVDGSVAYRVPASEELRELLKRSGPLVAPSANPESQEPAHTVEEAKAYFDADIDLYIDGGAVPAEMPPSRIIRIDSNGQQIILR